MPKTPEYARAAELEFEIRRLLIEIFDAYGNEARLTALQQKLAERQKELSALRTPQAVAA